MIAVLLVIHQLPPIAFFSKNALIQINKRVAYFSLVSQRWRVFPPLPKGRPTSKKSYTDLIHSIPELQTSEKKGSVFEIGCDQLSGQGNLQTNENPFP
jgi:hypothetical protein